jgi:hypothetical protein
MREAKTHRSGSRLGDNIIVTQEICPARIERVRVDRIVFCPVTEPSEDGMIFDQLRRGRRLASSFSTSAISRFE